MNKRIVVLGASQGIGAALVQHFAALPHTEVIALSRNLTKMQAQFQQTNVRCYALDISQNVVHQINELRLQGPFDILINNAGNAHGLSSIQEGNIDDWDAMIDSNVKGVLYVTKAIVPQMVERNNGFIVNIGSIAAKEVWEAVILKNGSLRGKKAATPLFATAGGMFGPIGVYLGLAYFMGSDTYNREKFTWANTGGGGWRRHTGTLN